MSSYVFVGNRLSYPEFLQGQEYVKDITSSTDRLSMAISRETCDLISSNQELSRQNIQATEMAAGQISETMNKGFSEVSSIMQDGFTQLSCDLQDISSGISELNATFSWGFCSMLASTCQ